MRYRFCITGVFTPTALGGNQLAVPPDPEGIWSSGKQGQGAEFALQIRPDGSIERSCPGCTRQYGDSFHVKHR